MDFLGLGGVSSQSPTRRTVYLYNLSQTHVKKHFGVLVQRSVIGDPCVDFLLDSLPMAGGWN